jgi:hypothetical protein
MIEEETNYNLLLGKGAFYTFLFSIFSFTIILFVSLALLGCETLFKFSIFLTKSFEFG